MPRRSRSAASTPIQIPIEDLYSTEPLTEDETRLLQLAEIAIRRQKLRRKVLPPKEIGSWNWNIFINAMGWAKSILELQVPVRLWKPHEESRMAEIKSEMENQYISRGIGYDSVLEAVDHLYNSGLTVDEILFRLSGKANSLVRRAGPFEVGNSGLFQVQ